MSIQLSATTGPGYTFNGSLIAPLNYNAPYTVMGWIYPLNRTANQAIFFVNGGSAANRDGLLLTARTSTAAVEKNAIDVQFITTVAGGTSLATTTNTLPIIMGNWYHLAMVRETDARMYIYLDGVRIISNPTSVAARTVATARLDIGRGVSYSAGFVGSVANVKAWSRGLTQAEVIAERPYGVPIAKDGVFAWYPTRVGAGANRGIDASGNGRNMAIYGTTTPAPTDGDNPPTLVTFPSPLPKPTASISFNGSTSTIRLQAIAAALSFGGTMTLSLLRQISAALNMSGDVTKGTMKRVAGSLSFGGEVRKRMILRLLASLTFMTDVSTTRRMIVEILGLLSFNGRVSRSFTRRVIGSLSFGGETRKTLTKRIEGAISFLASTTTARLLLIALGGAVSFTGAIKKQMIRSLGGSLSFSGGVVRRMTKTVAGAVSFGGMVARTHLIQVTGALGFDGGVKLQIAKIISASLSFVGEAKRSGMAIVIQIIGNLSFAGGAIYQAGKPVVIRIVNLIGGWKVWFDLDGEKSD